MSGTTPAAMGGQEEQATARVGGARCWVGPSASRVHVLPPTTCPPPRLPLSPFQEPGQKIIDVDTAADMLAIVLPDGRFTASFSEFLREQTVGWWW